MNNYEGLLQNGLPIREMTKDECEMMVRCVLMERDNDVREKIEETVFESVEVPQQLRVMRGRFQFFRKQVSAPLALFLASLCENPAQIVMWAYVLRVLATRNPEKVIGFDIWSQSFADGVPTEEAYKKAWAAQKGKFDNNIVVEGFKADNYLDTAEAWKAA